jgi:hypothetical protein
MSVQRAARPATKSEFSEDHMARTSQERKRRLAAPGGADAAAPHAGREANSGSDARQGVAESGFAEAGFAEVGRPAFALESTEPAADPQAADEAALAEAATREPIGPAIGFSDIGQTELALAAEGFPEASPGLRLVSADAGAHAGTGALRSPIVLGSPAASSDAARAAGAEDGSEPVGTAIDGTVRGNLDYADWSGIKGWIWDPAEPAKRIALELLDGDNLLATVSASEYRPDLADVGIGDGRHGFTIGFSETLLPFARHTLHLRPVGSTAELPSFPLELMRDHIGFDASAMRFLLGNVAAETARAQEPDDLAPMISNLVELLDQALSQYYTLAADKAAVATADILSPALLSGQVQTLVESIQRSYPPIHLDDTEPPVASIVIPVFNKFDLTYQCVQSIQEHGAEISYEIVIVDDCSRDETLFANFVFSGGIRLVRNSANLGFVRTCNRGFEAARGDYVVFLNNDTQVKPRWLDELYETLQRDDKIGIAGSKLHTRTAASRNAAASCGGSVTDGIGGAIRTPTIRVSAICATRITSPARH